MLRMNTEKLRHLLINRIQIVEILISGTHNYTRSLNSRWMSSIRSILCNKRIIGNTLNSEPTKSEHTLEFHNQLIHEQNLSLLVFSWADLRDINNRSLVLGRAVGGGGVGSEVDRKQKSRCRTREIIFQAIKSILFGKHFATI